MSVQELVDWCVANDVSLDTHIALRAKDDYFLTEDKVYEGSGYFGNSAEGWKWQKANSPIDEDGEPDYDKTPSVLILDTGRG